MSVEAARVKTHVDATPSTVWKALTTASSVKQFFLGADVVTDWKVGSPVSFRGEWKGKPYEDKGTIQTADVNQRLAFTHWSPLSGAEDKPENYHVVTFDLTPAGLGTDVVLTQTNLDDAEPLTEKSRQEFAKNWSTVLEGLKKVSEQPTA